MEAERSRYETISNTEQHTDVSNYDISLLHKELKAIQWLDRISKIWFFKFLWEDSKSSLRDGIWLKF